MAKEKDKKVTKRRKVRTVPSIYERIFNVQRDLQTVIKSTKHDHNNYMYATERDFIAEIKPLLTRERLVVVPDTASLTSVPNADGLMYHTVGVRFTLVSVDSQQQMVPALFYGSGVDKKGSVVGLPIAYTMALKYFLAKTFIAETGMDAEAHGSDDAKKPARGAGKDRAEGEEINIDTIRQMVTTSRNIGGLLDYKNNRLPTSTKLSKQQKDEIGKLIENRVNELQTGTGSSGDDLVAGLADIARGK